MHDEPTFGSQVTQGPRPHASRRARMWPRLCVFTFLTVLMLVALGGTSRASELDPNEAVPDVLDPVVETVADTADPVIETVTDTVEPVVSTVGETVDPIVENVTDTVDPIVETVTDTIDPVIGTVTDTTDPVVDTVISPTKVIVGAGGADPLEPLPWLPSPGVIVPDPRSAGGIADGEGDDGMTSVDRRGQLAGDLTWSAYPTTIAPSSGVPGLQPDTATGGGSTGLPSLPLGGRGAGSSVTLLFLLAALTMSVRAFKPPFLSSIVPRAVPMLGATLALSVERPG
jgi:hypothetical protein